MAKHDGVKMRVGGRELIIPALTIKQVRGLRSQFDAMQSIGDNVAPTDEQIGAVTEVIHSAVVRNYPDLTLDDLEELLDLSTMQAVVKAIMGQSGLEVVSSGEA